jgi:hypothetical protein
VIRIIRGAGETGAEARATLGYSVIDTPSGIGTLATIFIDRIERIARHAGADYPSLTGRAIAHEVGHLLLGTNTHGESGLMREVWTEQELFQNRREDWVFAARERGQLRSAWLPVSAAARLRGSAPAVLPGNATVGLPVSAPVGLPGSAPVGLPAEAAASSESR